MHLEGKGPQRRPQRRLGRRLEEVAKAVGGGYCRLPMPLRPALGIRETAAGHRLGALEGGGGDDVRGGLLAESRGHGPPALGRGGGVGGEGAECGLTPPTVVNPPQTAVSRSSAVVGYPAVMLAGGGAFLGKATPGLIPQEASRRSRVLQGSGVDSVDRESPSP